MNRVYDLKILAKILLEDLALFPDRKEDVARIYLEKAWDLGDQNGWWVHQDSLRIGGDEYGMWNTCDTTETRQERDVEDDTDGRN